MTENKIINLSTRWLGSLKIVFYLIYSLLFCLMIGIFVNGEAYMGAFFNLGVYGYGLFFLVRMTRNLQEVSFDGTYMYVKNKIQDLVIPLENIEAVEVHTLGGTYKVNLYHAEQLGREFYFKCSMLYPLNYKRKDALVNVLRKYIEKAKGKRHVMPQNALQS